MILRPAELLDREFVPGETAHGYLQNINRGGWVVQLKTPDENEVSIVAQSVLENNGIGKSGDHGKESPTWEFLRNWERREVFVGTLPTGEILADVSPDRLQENLRNRLEGKELPDPAAGLDEDTLARVRTYARVLDSSTLDYVSYSGPDTAQLIQEWAAENPQRLERLARQAVEMRDRASEYARAAGLGAYQVTNLSQGIKYALHDRGVSLPSQGDLDPELVAHLEQRNRIRQGESLATGARGEDWPGGLPTGLGGDRVANAEAFTQRYAEQHPEQAKEWAQKLRTAPKEYGHAAGLPEDSIGLVAKQMEEGAQHGLSPEVGDLVRFEPHAHLERVSPFSGRVIAKLDTSGGDYRYHLRAESGPDKGMDVRVYGRQGTFRSISPEQAVGFDLVPIDPKEQAINEYVNFHKQLPGNVDKLIKDIEERFAKVDMTDQKAFADAMTKTQIQADEVFGIIREGPDRGMSRSELALEKADVDPGKRAELRHARWDAFEAQSNRYRDALDRAREQMKERLKAKGRDMLRAPEALSPQEVTAACLWKRGIPVTPQSEQIGKFVEAVEKKDLARLLSSIGHNSQNPGSQEAFSRLTGVPLGKTEKERVAQIKNWVGQEKVVAHEKAQEERSLAQANEVHRKELRRAADALSYVSVDLEARKVDGFQFVEQMAKEGFTEVHSRKRGAAVQRYLVNPETDKTTWLKNSRFQEFCKAVQAVEPSGNLLKAMEIAKIPLDVQVCSQEKKSPDLPPAAGKELSSEDKKRVAGIQGAYENLRNIAVRVTDPDGSTRVIDGRQYLEEKVAAGRTQVVARKEGAIVKRYLEDPKERAFSGVRDKRFGEFLKRIEEFEPTKNVETAMARAGVERLSLAEVQKPALAVAGPEASVATKMEPDPQVAKAFVQRPEAEPTRTEGVGNGDRPKGLPLDIVLPQLPGGAENKVILASSPDVGGLSKINCRVLSVSHTGSSAQIEHAGKTKRLELSVNDLLAGARLPEGVRPQAVGKIAIGKDRQVRFTPKLERGKTLERQPENTGKQQALGI